MVFNFLLADIEAVIILCIAANLPLGPMETSLGSCTKPESSNVNKAVRVKQGRAAAMTGTFYTIHPTHCNIGLYDNNLLRNAKIKILVFRVMDIINSFLQYKNIKNDNSKGTPLCTFKRSGISMDRA